MSPARPPEGARTAVRQGGGSSVLRYALVGDGDSPHLLKWARALARQPDVELWVASSRGFLPGFDEILPTARRLALDGRPGHGGGNLAALQALPRLAAWLRRVDADWLNPHYLTSHGTLVWLAKRLWRLRGRIVGSAWGSDILVTPERSRAYRAVTRRVLEACTLCTSDSLHMSERMRALGAPEVMTFPFGLEVMPPAPAAKSPWLFYANRGLEPIYRPERVLEFFAAVRATRPDARLVVANDGSLRAALQARAQALGVADAVHFTGRLDADAQARWYGEAQWYLSLPESDSVSVSVLEAMGHGCIPLLSDLPANRELVRDGENGAILTPSSLPAVLDPLAREAADVAAANRDWVARHALFGPSVAALLARLQTHVPA